jgi:hypothetical protein
MLAGLKRASRRSIALIWALALVFAFAPALSMAFAAPVGAFSRVFLHAHEYGDEDHVHHGHHHHHDEHHGHHHHDDAMDDGQNDQGSHHLHVHWDASCPSVLVPVLTLGTLQNRVADRFTVPPAEPMLGASPDRILRPPIPSSLL